MAKITGNNKANRLDGTSTSDTISGGGGDDRLAGHRGNDTLNGDAGNDKIGGGQDHDVLTGGSGKDTFVFNSFAPKDTDKVTDFVTKTDKLQFDHSVFDLSIGKLDAIAFHAGTKAHDASDRFIYDKKTGNLYYDDDGNGGHAQHLVATFTNHATLSASDFFIS
jgi:cysteinyl-tRNA synthetase